LGCGVRERREGNMIRRRRRFPCWVGRNRVRETTREGESDHVETTDREGGEEARDGRRRVVSSESEEGRRRSWRRRKANEEEFRVRSEQIHTPQEKIVTH